MATWVLADESCNINYKQNGVSHRTLPKDLTVLEIVLAGEPLNDTSVDCVFVRYEGKYAIELPYNDTTIGATSYASAELLRAAILALLNSNPCSGGSGSVGTLQTVTDSGNTTTNNIAVQDNGDPTIQSVITPTGIQVSDGGVANLFEASNAGVSVGDGTAVKHTINADGSVTVGGSTFVTVKRHLTSAQIRTGNSVPIVLVSAAGSGTAIYAWHDTTARCINGVVPAVAGNMEIRSQASVKPMINFDGQFLTATNGDLFMGDDSIAVNGTNLIKENSNLICRFDADNPLYDGTIDIYLKYEIITL